MGKGTGALWERRTSRSAGEFFSVGCQAWLDCKSRHSERRTARRRGLLHPLNLSPNLGLRRRAQGCTAGCSRMIRASPGSRPYREMLGEVVLKHFEGHGTFMGTIIEYDEQTGFRIQAATRTHLSLGLGGGSVPSEVSACLFLSRCRCTLAFSHRAPTSGASLTTATQRTSASATLSTSCRRTTASPWRDPRRQLL